MQPIAYLNDSPEAMARLLTALMAIDERIDDAEVEALSKLDAYARLSITPPRFADVLRAYFAAPSTGAPAAGGSVNLAAPIDHSQYTPLIDCITEPARRALLWDILVGLARADGELDDREAALLRLIALRWWQGEVPARLRRIDVPLTARAMEAGQSALHAAAG